MSLRNNSSLKEPTYPRVSSRELEVASHIAQGETTIEIAKRLFLSVHTVMSHRKNLMAKLEARNTSHLVAICFERGIFMNRKSHY